MKSKKPVFPKWILVFICLLILIGVGFFSYQWFNGLIPRVIGLKVVRVDELERKEAWSYIQHSVWPGGEVPKIVYSPDNKYYIKIEYTNGSKEWDKLSLYRASPEGLFGTYVFKHLNVWGWSQDSKYIYFRDVYKWGSSSIFIIFSTSDRQGPLKKIVVPQE